MQEEGSFCRTRSADCFLSPLDRVRGSWAAKRKLLKKGGNKELFFCFDFFLPLFLNCFFCLTLRKVFTVQMKNSVLAGE